MVQSCAHTSVGVSLVLSQLTHYVLLIPSVVFNLLVVCRFSVDRREGINGTNDKGNSNTGLDCSCTRRSLQLSARPQSYPLAACSPPPSLFPKLDCNVLLGISTISGSDPTAIRVLSQREAFEFPPIRCKTARKERAGRFARIVADRVM